MERIYAFTDEYGAFGWDIANPTVSTHFIITAVLVKDSELAEYAAKAEEIRKKHFQTGEMKSSKVALNHHRREMILNDIMQLPCNFFSVCIDKKACMLNMNSRGLQYKKTFYKFMNNIVHKELKRAFTKLTIVADEIGSNDYMASFCGYVEARQDIPDLLNEVNFSFSRSHADVRIQVADFISGTLAYAFDDHKKNLGAPDFLSIIRPKVTRIEIYPKTLKSYILEDSALADDYDRDIASLCFRQAAIFVENNSDSEDSEIKAQVIVAQYLLFRFMNNSTRGYIYTSELRDQLRHTDMAHISESTFRMRIIGKLRDNGVIIASSNRGYKIPSKRSELYDFINHDAKIVIPMLARLKRCRDLVKLATNNDLDLLDQPEYSTLKGFFDSQPN